MQPGPGPIFIIGAGPGVGASTARRFARAGHPVGLIARNPEHLKELAQELTARDIDVATAAADATDPDAIAAAIGSLTNQLGTPEVICFSPLPNIDLIKPVLDTRPADLRAGFDLSVVGAAATVRAVLPAMLEAGRGTLLFVTGSAVINPSPDRAMSAVTGFAQKSYLELLAAALAEEAVHVAHLVVVGAIGHGQKHEPDTVADTLWRLHHEHTETYAVLP
jgi:NADP-dependent 3-hydroxy acid dehydrogenase YdfG